MMDKLTNAELDSLRATIGYRTLMDMLAEREVSLRGALCTMEPTLDMSSRYATFKGRLAEVQSIINWLTLTK